MRRKWDALSCFRIMQPKQFSLSSQCIALLCPCFPVSGYLINKTTFRYRFFECVGCGATFVIGLSCFTQPWLYWSGPSLSSWLRSGQSLWASWVPLDTTQVFWSRCQYTPTPAICRWAFSPATPRIFPLFSSTRVLLHLLEMSAQWWRKKLLDFFYF